MSGCLDDGLTQGSGVDRSGHGLHLREDLFGEEPEALFGLVPRHAAIHHVDHDLLHADGLLHRLNLLDYLVRGADRLSRATRGEPGLRRTYIGGLSQQVFLVATYALVAWGCSNRSSGAGPRCLGF